VATNFGNIGKVPELRQRIMYTLGMLAVYRIGVFVTSPGVDRVAMGRFVKEQSGTFLGLFNMFSGGAIEQLSVFALGIMPYISASIIFQLLQVVVPALERLSKEGDAGRKKITQYTRYATILSALVQGIAIAKFLESIGGVVAEPGMWFKFVTVVTLTTGTAFIMWLGERITERGIGNGISLIIFAGIIAGLPDAVMQMWASWRNGLIQNGTLLLIGLVVVSVIGVIIFFERAHRRIPVQYAKRVVGQKVYGGQSQHLPLKVNTAGVIPPIFASSILMFPATIAGFLNMDWINRINALLVPGNWIYNVVFSAMVIFFCYFYTAVVFNPVDVADRLKKNGGYIPGIRPGKKTAEYIDHVLSRITMGGAIYIAAVCVLPAFMQEQFNVPFYFGGTGLLIVVGVAMDTVQQIESHLITRNYEGLSGSKGPRIRGRRARA
jgi:preprotein translocase subunit SecY